MSDGKELIQKKKKQRFKTDTLCPYFSIATNNIRRQDKFRGVYDAVLIADLTNLSSAKLEVKLYYAKK